MIVPRFQIQNINRIDIPKPSLKPPQSKSSQNQGIQLHQNANGILQPSFVCGVIGNPGCGKSSLIKHMMLENEIFHQKFQRVVFITPTLYEGLITDSFNHSKNLDIDWIYEKIQEANIWGCKSMLIVMDDVISQLKGNHDSKLIDLFYNRRHLLKKGCINILVTAQKWNMLPVYIRSGMNMVFLYSLSKQQAQALAREIHLPVPNKVLISLLGQLKKNRFIYINTDEQKLYNSKWEAI